VNTKLLSALIWLYAIACVLVLILIPPSRNDWFGILRHPHGGVPALFLALPWSLVMSVVHYHGTAYSTLLVAFAMAINLFLLITLKRRKEEPSIS
jgi:hypothetical protein